MTALISVHGCEHASIPARSIAEPRPTAEQKQIATAVVSHVDSELRRHRELNIGETVLVRQVLSSEDSGQVGTDREDVPPPGEARWEEWPEQVGSLNTRGGEIRRLGLGDASPEAERQTRRRVWVQLARPRVAADGTSASVEAEVWMNRVFGGRSVFQLRRVNLRWGVVSEDKIEFW